MQAQNVVFNFIFLIIHFHTFLISVRIFLRNPDPFHRAPIISSWLLNTTLNTPNAEAVALKILFRRVHFSKVVAYSKYF